MILVTGGTGLLGSHLLYHLLQTEQSIKALYRNEEKLKQVKSVFSYYSDNSELLFEKIEWVKGDVLNLPSLDNAFKNITTVYHSAAIVAFDRGSDKLMNKVNIEGTANIVNLCLSNNVQKLCHVSSIATISKPIDGSEATEDDYWNPDALNSGYAISKNGAEMEVWRGIEEGLDAVIVNPSIIIGPGFWNNSSGKLFTTVNNGIKFYTDGGTGFVGVNDVSRAMIQLMKSDIVNERFIINAENLPYKKIFSTIALSLGLKPPTIRTKKWMLSLAWRLDVLKVVLFGAKQRLNKDSARSSRTTSKFSNKKIKKALEFSFKPIDEIIEDTSKLFITDKG
ncbi:MAG: SDR family oxidoreductase [Flavobacteriales bacterium]|nr:SDR family oxidoreductase [Flavobacteriales bacterium]